MLKSQMCFAQAAVMAFATKKPYCRPTAAIMEHRADELPTGPTNNRKQGRYFTGRRSRRQSALTFRVHPVLALTGQRK